MVIHSITVSGDFLLRVGAFPHSLGLGVELLGVCPITVSVGEFSVADAVSGVWCFYVTIGSVSLGLSVDL